MKIFAIVAFASALMLSSSASAWDYTGYHGSACLQDNVDTGAFSRSEYRITRKGSSGSSSVLCPIERQSFKFCTHAEQMTVWVDTQDYHTNGSVTCYLIRKDRKGGTVAWDGASTYGSSYSRQTLTLSIYADQSTTDRYLLRCSMPTNSGSGYTKIYGYKVREPVGCE